MSDNTAGVPDILESDRTMSDGRRQSESLVVGHRGSTVVMEFGVTAVWEGVRKYTDLCPCDLISRTKSF